MASKVHVHVEDDVDAAVRTTVDAWAVVATFTANADIAHEVLNPCWPK